MEKFKPYFAADLVNFNKLSAQEQAKRIKDWGTPDLAISQYGLELAEKSVDQPDVILSLEQQEELEELKKSASGILKSFKLNPQNLGKMPEQGENLLIVVENEVDDLVKKAFYESARQDFGANANMLVISDLATSGANLPETARAKMLSATNLLLLGIRSLSHSDATKEAWTKRAYVNKKLTKQLETVVPENSEHIAEQWQRQYPGAAIISIPDAYKHSFMHECYQVDKNEITAKVFKIKELIDKAQSAQVTSPSGTNLVVNFDHTKYPILEEKPDILPGGFMNSPSGETALRPANVNGRFVIDGFCADNPLEIDAHNNVKNPIELNFINGFAQITPGTAEADRLIAMCESARQKSIENGQEQNPYQIAEFAVGVLGKQDADGKIKFTLDNATIDEKLTLHLAIGADHILGGTNSVPIHIDFGGQFISVVLSGPDNKKVKILDNGRLMLDKKGNLIQ